jgi:membrane-bound ClpP family serine protease
MAVYYTSYPFHPENGFYYIGLHGFTFPLIYTWELMFNKLFNVESIILFKMINPLYSFFLLILVFEEVKTISKTYAFWSVLLIAMSMGFIFNALQFHLEMLREFLFLVFVSFFIRALKDASIKNILLFAAIAGLQSTIHSIGAIAACIALALILLKLYLSNMDRKIQTSMFAVLFLLVFGWIHYLLDIFIGTGWILK